MMLHTILLQNNFLHEIPTILKEIPSLRVIQLDGNPCANQLKPVGVATEGNIGGEAGKLCSSSHFGSLPAKNLLQKEEFYYPMLLKTQKCVLIESSLVQYFPQTSLLGCGNICLMFLSSGSAL